MPFTLFVAKCKVLDTLGSRISVCFGIKAISVFPSLEHSEIINITLGFKTNVFVFKGIFVFYTLVFL